jgi:mediator of RNA polymerase II transcription subunit 21
MIASLFYINRHHDFQTLGPKDVVRQDKQPEGEPERDKESMQLLIGPLSYPTNIASVEPHPPDVFKAGQKELAQDLIVKEQQIEYLISVLPGLENSEKDQEEIIQQLEVELKEAEVRRREALKEKEAVLARLESVIRSVKRP